MTSYTIITGEFDRTPEGYRREIGRLRKLVESHPEDDGYRSALRSLERAVAMGEAIEGDPRVAAIVAEAVAKLKQEAAA